MNGEIELDLLDLEGNQIIEENIENKLTADWVKKEMDAEEWRKLSEKERQELLMKAKLAQRQLRKEMFGDDWMRKLESLKGDEARV